MGEEVKKEDRKDLVPIDKISSNIWDGTQIYHSTSEDDEIKDVMRELSKLGALPAIPAGEQRNPAEVCFRVLAAIKKAENHKLNWDDFIGELSINYATWDTYKKYFDGYKRKGAIAYKERDSITYLADGMVGR